MFTPCFVRSTRYRCWWTCALLGLVIVAASRGAEFAPVFTSGAVLQRELPLTIWGTGRDGEAVTVEVLGHKAETVVREGRWQVELPALPATASTPLRLRGDKVVELADVAIGEVWIGSGQSNMEWRLNQCAPHTDALLAEANTPGVRQIKIPLRPFAGDPLPKFGWKAFDRANAGQFGAVAYYFAAELHRKLGVVVGIVNCSFGGTPIEAWMSREAITRAGADSLLADDARKAAAFPTVAAYEQAWQTYLVARKEWDTRQKAGVPAAELGAEPVAPYGFRTKGRPAGLHASMLGVITPYTARGVLWYQGENNAGKPTDYAKLLAGLITEWRGTWGRPDLPFFIGQLASPTANNRDEGDSYALIREAQRAVALATPHSGLAVTLDYGERGNVHPKQKQPVGERFARLALARVYGEKGFAAQSPTAEKASLAGERIEISFADLPASGRLVIRDPALPSLEVKRGTGEWKPATASLAPDGRTLLVTVPPADANAGAPTGVRYAYRNFCTLSLYTDEGLPVSPWTLQL
jgi:sialate O-acetylesterase